MTRRPTPATVKTITICTTTHGPKTPPHEPRSRNDARRNAIHEALQPLQAIARTLNTGSDREG